MNNNTSNNFCKNYVYKYVECLNLNYSVFGKEHGENMCDHIKKVLENTNCNIKKEFNMNLIDIEKMYKSLPSPTSRD